MMTVTVTEQTGLQAHAAIAGRVVVGSGGSARPAWVDIGDLPVLARAGIFQGVEPGAVAALTSKLQPVDFPQGHTVFAEGGLVTGSTSSFQGG